MITEKQIDFCTERSIKVGNDYLLPSYGFRIYHQADYRSDSVYINTNPFTRSLDFSPIRIKLEKNEFYYMSFADSETAWYISKHDMEARSIFTSLFLVLTLYPLFHIWNYLIK